MRVRSIAGMFGLVAGFGLVTAASGAKAADPVGFTCDFRMGTTLDYNNAKFTRKVAKPLGVVIEAIDLDGQKAELVTDKGRGSLRVVRALNANHYLEVVGEGFLNITTIYDFDAKGKGTPGRALPSFRTVRPADNCAIPRLL